jgi:CrcB protein
MASSTSASRRQEIWNGAILYGCVGLGGVIGSCARYLASVFALSQFGPGFPLGTLFVNVTGSFAIGFYAALTGPDGRVFAGTRQRQFVMTGICGGYTTFSAFSLETFQLLRSGHALTALLNVGISVIGWLAAVWLGHTLASRINRLKGT